MLRFTAILALHALYVLVTCEDHSSMRMRRDLSMLRMGKRSMGLIRRSLNLPPLVPPAYDSTGEDLEERDLLLDGELENQVWVPRVGKHLEYELPASMRLSRAPPYPRVGKTFEDYLNEYRREMGDDEIRQVLFKIPRVGRSARTRRSVDEQEEHVDAKVQEKRAAPFPRLGLREEEALNDEERAAPFPRLGLFDRAAPFPRLGLRDDVKEEEERYLPRFGLRDYEELDDALNNDVRAAPFPRLGLREEEERAAPFPRLGYRDVEKRPMSMLRMGRSGPLEEEKEKKAMSMLRMGKRGMSMLRMGKRAMGMLRMGRSDGEEKEKRAMSMLRMGKRAMGMLRMGRALEPATPDEEKRGLSMLRMGKRNMDEAAEKRAMGMLRMGRSMTYELPEEGKRAMGMLRMGKRDVGDAKDAVESEHHAEAADENKAI